MRTKKTMRSGMKKAMVIFITSCLFLLAMAPAVSAATPREYEFPSGASPVSVMLDGKQVLQGEAAIIASVTYVPLRSFCELAGADSIVWNASTRTATVKYRGMAMYVTDGGCYVSVAGRYFHTVERILNINDRLFVPIRPLAKVFSIKVDWNAATRTVELRSTDEVLRSGSSFYNADELYWLSRIIYAEAGGESLAGQIAVGNVVLNRKAHPSYPNTVYGVIFDRRGGTQFTPVAIGTIYRTPSESAIIAAKICLEGHTISTEALFFMNPRLATSNWISKNCRFLFTIGNHDFYGVY